ncbi:hypothetical protein OROGR_016248 [Orobanche gracilis]
MFTCLKCNLGVGCQWMLDQHNIKEHPEVNLTMLKAQHKFSKRKFEEADQALAAEEAAQTLAAEEAACINARLAGRRAAREEASKVVVAPELNVL